MVRRRYSKSEKAHAVGLALVEGVTETERQTGIPKSTVFQWMHADEYEHLRTKTRDQVADEMWTAIQIGVREVVKGLAGEAPLRDKSVALGILYDKHALLTGGATSRSETRSLEDISDADLVNAIREAERIAGSG
jgi:transposase-like protein